MIYTLLQLRKKIILLLSSLMLLQGVSVQGGKNIPFRGDAIPYILNNLQKKTAGKKTAIDSQALQTIPGGASTPSFSLKSEKEIAILKNKLKKNKSIPRVYIPFLSSKEIHITIYKIDTQAMKNLSTKVYKDITKKEIRALYGETQDNLTTIQEKLPYNENDGIAAYIKKQYIFDSPDFKKAAIKFWMLFVCVAVCIIGSIVSLVYYFKQQKKKKKISAIQKEEVPTEKENTSSPNTR